VDSAERSEKPLTICSTLGQARGPNLWHSAGKLEAFLSTTSLAEMCGSRGTSRDAAVGRDGSSANHGKPIPLRRSHENEHIRF